MIENQKIEVTHPKNQLNLFGYDAYFKSFVKLFEKEEMPHCVLNNNFEKDVKIQQVRSLLKFLSKTTFSKDLKIVMIDNIENFNLNSANALLKSLEEPRDNTFFFYYT